jgi:hypothetical protein
MLMANKKRILEMIMRAKTMTMGSKVIRAYLKAINELPHKIMAVISAQRGIYEDLNTLIPKITKDLCQKVTSKGVVEFLTGYTGSLLQENLVM